MSLSAKLALSQLRINRSRTAWTLLGIVLSTALITAVWNFAASGAKLSSGIQNSTKILPILLLPAILLSVIIVVMSVVVVSNAFRVSADERTAQFGILKSVGATNRQITEMVVYESVLLSAIGIPLGIVVGLLLALAGVGVANVYLGQLNRLIHIMVNKFTLIVEFGVSWLALVVAAAISFGTVLLSAWLPARKAAKVSAITAIRGTDEVAIREPQIRTSRLSHGWLGAEASLAAKNMKRSKRKFRTSIATLTVSVVLFVVLGSLSSQVRQIRANMFPDIHEPVFVEYISADSDYTDTATGRRVYEITAPIDNDTANALTRKLQSYGGGTELFGVGTDMRTFRAVVPKAAILPEMMPKALETYTDADAALTLSDLELSAELQTLDDATYAAFCEAAGVPVGSTILLNRYDYTEKGKRITITPFDLRGQTLPLVKADGTQTPLAIDGVLPPDAIPNELLAPNVQTVRIVVPSDYEHEWRSYSWYAAPSDIEGFMDYANAVLGEAFPHSSDEGYMESGFSTRVYLFEDYLSVMNIAIGFVSVFVYTFVALLTLIGLTNVISTISANVRLRRREFAVLQSVGMTRGGLRQMLNFENIICTAKSLVVGLPFALLITYLLNLPLSDVFPIPYELPWLAAIQCIIGVFIITWATTRYSAFRLGSGSIMEALRGGE
jgi:putative ABC transport system permease protein